MRRQSLKPLVLNSVTARTWQNGLKRRWLGKIIEVSVDRGRGVAHLHTLVPVKRLPWPKLPGKSRLHFLAYR